MKNSISFLIILVLFTLSGCSSVKTGSPSDKTWYKPGTSAEERMRDLAMCQNEAAAYGNSSFS
jgi:uncharacterized protein YceK